MAASYRDKLLRCPTCSTPMRSQASELAVVDVCPDCSGLWIDWFDGEIASVASSVGDLPPTPAATKRGGACPLCALALVATPYGDDAVVVLRCGGCAGAFVPRDAFEQLVREGPPRDPDEDEGGLIAHIVAWLRAHIG